MNIIKTGNYRPMTLIDTDVKIYKKKILANLRKTFKIRISFPNQFYTSICTLEITKHFWEKLKRTNNYPTVMKTLTYTMPQTWMLIAALFKIAEKQKKISSIEGWIKFSMVYNTTWCSRGKKEPASWKNFGITPKHHSKQIRLDQ